MKSHQRELVDRSSPASAAWMLDLKNPPTAVGGIQSRAAWCRLDLKHPPTSVGGILCALTHQVSDSISPIEHWRKRSCRVTFKYKDSGTKQVRFCTLTAEEFIRRFLQHVLPPRFVKVRYFGLMSPGNRHLLTKARVLLGARLSDTNLTEPAAPKTTEPEPGVKERTTPPCCQRCGTVLTLIREIRRSGVPP